jgi:hypothetical protein
VERELTRVQPLYCCTDSEISTMIELSDGDPRLDQAAKREDYPTSLDAGLSWKMAVEADFQPGDTIHRGLEEASTNLQRFPRAQRTLGAPDGRMHKRWRHHAAEPRPEREQIRATVPGSCWAGGGSLAGKFSLSSICCSEAPPET